MNILIPILRFGASGGLRVLSKISDEWIKKGNNVVFLNMTDSKPYFPVHCNIVSIHAKNTIHRYIKTIQYICQNIDNYDVVICNFCLTTLPVFIAALLKNNINKGIYYIQAYEPDFFPVHTIKWAYAILSYKLPFMKIVNSNLYTDYKLLHTNKVVYPGLDLENYFSKDMTFFNKKIKIGTIGRTEEWKGTADVCRAMEILKAEGIPFDFYIAFNDFETIEHRFVKPDGDEKLAAFYRDMDIIVAAGKGQHGAIHYPIIETMAVGSTIVCTDYYPADNDNAYKVDESSPAQIAEAIKEVLNNKKRAIEKRKNALKDVQQFSWPIVAEKFMSYLKEEENRK